VYAAGSHAVTWDAGRRLPHGLYFARLATGGESRSLRLVRI